MSVTEVAGALGEWNVSLREDTPMEVLDQLGYFGHIAITGARVDVEAAGDALLTDARYVGVLRDRSFGDGNKIVKGSSMALWLGDEDDKGEVIEEPIVFANATFTQVITALLPASIQPGLITPIAGTYSGTHVFQSRRKAIDYVCGLFDAEWRIRGGFLDAGPIASLYVTDPKAAILRNRSGAEMTYKAMPGNAQLDSDVKDFTTRVLLLAEGSEATTVSATANILPAKNPYVDLFGNPVIRTRIVSEQQTSEGNAQARAQLQLNRFTSPRDALKLSTYAYDVRGDVTAGDQVWVYDPEAKLIDETNPVDFQGQDIYPLKLRVFQLSWPISEGMGVAYRAGNGTWIDLTDYVNFETGETDITVGGYNRSLTGTGGLTGDPGSRPIENSTTPAQVDWNLPFVQGTYQSEADGLTRAQIVLDWDQPLNTDGSVITDGFAYEIRWRTGEVGVYPTTHADMAVYQHQNLDGSQASPIPFTVGAYQYTQVSWDDTQFLMLDLTPGIPYEFQIRAIDTGTPPKVSDWSDVALVQTRPDTVAPSTPAPAQTVAGSRNAVQIVHTLGRATGGTFNLEADLNHLQIHSAEEPTYLTDPRPIVEGGTLLGKLYASQGMLRGKIPAVGTFPIDEVPGKKRFIKIVAVDHFGNESGPSEPMEQTAVLIDSAFISELTVTKVSAGFIQSPWILGSTIQTAQDGARVVIAWYGIEVFNIDNLKTLDIDSATGNIEMVGRVASGRDGSRVVLGDQGFPTIRFFTVPGGTNSAFINSFDDNDDKIGLGLNSGSTDDGVMRTITYMRPTRVQTIVAAGPNHPTLPDQTRIGGEMFVGADIVQGGVHRSAGNAGQLAVFGADRTAAWIRTLDPDGTVDRQVLVNLNGDVRMDRGGVDEGLSALIMDSGGVKVFIDGLQAFRARNPPGSAGPFIESSRYCSPNEGPFRGQLSGASGTFAFRGGTGDADPILDATGFSARFVKNFVIEHPENKDRWLVHACTETPEAAVEYSGYAFVEKWGELIEVTLPSYFEAETHFENRQVWLQAMLNPEAELLPYMPRTLPSYPKDGKFYITHDAYPGTAICYKVKAVRKDVPQFEVEPRKDQYRRAGTGPYTWLEEIDGAHTDA